MLREPVCGAPLRQKEGGRPTRIGRVGQSLRRLLRDENGSVWIGAHFGSRGFGHASATKYLKLADGKEGIK